MGVELKVQSRLGGAGPNRLWTYKFGRALSHRPGGAALGPSLMRGPALGALSQEVDRRVARRAGPPIGNARGTRIARGDQEKLHMAERFSNQWGRVLLCQGRPGSSNQGIPDGHSCDTPIQRRGTSEHK